MYLYERQRMRHFVRKRSYKENPAANARDFWVTNGARTHDPQNHNLVL